MRCAKTALLVALLALLCACHADLADKVVGSWADASGATQPATSIDFSTVTFAKDGTFEAANCSGTWEIFNGSFLKLDCDGSTRYAEVVRVNADEMLLGATTLGMESSVLLEKQKTPLESSADGIEAFLFGSKITG